MGLESIATPRALGVGLALGGIAAAASLQPSIAPRTAQQQAILTGVCAAGGLGIGAAVAAGANRVAGHVPGGAVATFGAMVAGGLALHWLTNRGDGQHGPLVGGIGSAGTVAAAVGAAGLAIVGARLLGASAAAALPASLARTQGIVRALTGPALVASGVGALALMYHARSGASSTPPSRVLDEARIAADHIGGKATSDTPGPLLPTVSGEGASGISYESLGKHGKRFVHEAVPGSLIRQVMGDGIDPIRVYAGLDTASTADGRVAAAMADAERLGAFDGSRTQIIIATPTGSGFVDPPSVQAAEFMARGRTAAIAIQYNDQPSIQSTGKVPLAAETTRKLIAAVRARVDQMPAGQRPEVVLFGESLGAWSQEDVFKGHGIDSVAAAGVDRVLWVGSPQESGFAREAMTDPANTGQAGTFDRIEDVDRLTAEQRDHLRVVMLTHDNDPVANVDKVHLGYQRPSWLPAHGDHPNNVPDDMQYIPGVSLGQGIIDLWNGTHPVPGVFGAYSHDYRADLAEFVRVAYGHDGAGAAQPVSDDQVQAITDQLVQMELNRAAIMQRDPSY